jgi:hypothetical protein
MAFQSGSLSTAAENFLTAAREIDLAFAKRMAVGRVPELKELRVSYMHNYVRLIDRLTSDQDRHIEVWLAVVDAFKFFVRSSGLIRLGVGRLRSWWAAVEERKKLEVNTANQLGFQLKQLDSVIQACKEQEFPDDELVEYCSMTSEALATRLSQYREKLGTSLEVAGDE